MATEHDAAARERMKKEPYAPITVGSVDERYSHALTYAAFYLGEIAAELRTLNVNGEKTILELQGIARVLASKT